MASISSIGGLTPEQMVLLGAAESAWHLLSDAKKLGSPLGEETLTELTLLQLKKTFPQQKLSIVSFNKVKEGSTGADWAWAFANHDASSVVAMLVQAKILNGSGTEYDELDRKIGKTAEKQIDRLLSTAIAYGWPAIYAFYNHSNHASPFPPSCKTFADAYVVLPESWGISFADAYSVKQKLHAKRSSDKSLVTHAGLSLPLHCLLCSGASGVRPPGGTPEAVLQGLHVLRQGVFGREAYIAPEYAIPPRPLRELPRLFTEALRVYQVPEEIRDVEIARLHVEYPNVAGVLVVQDQQLDQAGGQ